MRISESVLKMKLDYSSLENAVSQLRKSFDYVHSDLAKNDSGLRDQFRAATVQAFEFSYELAIKMVRRQLARIAANPDALRALDFADVMREAADARIIRDALSFMRYRELRNMTSHTYNAAQAEATVAAVNDFLSDMAFLLKELEKRNRETR